MTDALETLVRTLLYEGYALYPYTPGATKNATPTPFGIVYPPAYAARGAGTHDHLQLDCVLAAGSPGPVTAEIRFLRADGARHQASEERVALPAGGGAASVAVPGLAGTARLGCTPAGDGTTRVRVRLENTTTVDADGMGRAEALAAAFLSTHVVVRAEGGRFLSPLEDAGRGESVNTFPVLATPSDDAVLGAAIVLPDHPQLAPESLGDLFDGTEIEEALLLHVQVLSDEERASIAAQDPAVREMIARAARAAPADLLRLHGRLRMEDHG